MFPALADVRAMGFFTDRMEPQVPHHGLEPQVVGATWRPDLEPVGLPLGELEAAMASHDLVEGV
jgi:hypothetical protein